VLQAPVVLSIHTVVRALIAVGDFVRQSGIVLPVEQEVGNAEPVLFTVEPRRDSRGAAVVVVWPRENCGCKVEKRTFWKLTPASARGCRRSWYVIDDLIDVLVLVGGGPVGLPKLEMPLTDAGSPPLRGNRDPPKPTLAAKFKLAALDAGSRCAGS